MSLIYGVPEMAEEEVLEQIAFQAVQYLRLDDPKYKKADTLSKILVAAKDKPKEDEIVYIEALESIIGENGSYKDVKAKLFCPEIAGLFCRIAGLFCHDSRANLSLKPVCFGIAIS